MKSYIGKTVSLNIDGKTLIEYKVHGQYLCEAHPSTDNKISVTLTCYHEERRRSIDFTFTCDK